MKIETIKVVIDKNGELKLEVEGVEGSNCIELSRELLAALGSEIATELKPEYYLEDAQVSSIKQAEGN